MILRIGLDCAEKKEPQIPQIPQIDFGNYPVGKPNVSSSALELMFQLLKEVGPIESSLQCQH